MRSVRRAVLVVLSAGALAVPAGAQPGAPHRGDESPGRPDREARGERSGEDRRGERGRGERRGFGNYAENFLRSHDRDRDGEVTFDEFRVGKMMENMSEEGKKRIFDHLDKDGDGKITRGELPGGGPGRGGAPWQDKDGDGKISYEEFAASDLWPKEATPEERRRYFDRMDLNKDGFLTAEDFRWRPPGLRRWDRRRPSFDLQALRKLDKNNDGALSFEEWSASPLFENVPRERLREWFDRWDRNGDGVLDEADRPDGPPDGGPGGERPEGPPRR